MAKESNSGITYLEAGENVQPEHGTSDRDTAKHDNFRGSIDLDLRSTPRSKTGQSYGETSDIYKKYTVTPDVTDLYGAGILSYGFTRF